MRWWWQKWNLLTTDGTKCGHYDPHLPTDIIHTRIRIESGFLALRHPGWLTYSRGYHLAAILPLLTFVVSHRTWKYVKNNLTHCLWKCLLNPPAKFPCVQSSIRLYVAVVVSIPGGSYYHHLWNRSVEYKDWGRKIENTKWTARVSKSIWPCVTPVKCLSFALIQPYRREKNLHYKMVAPYLPYATHIRP